MTVEFNDIQIIPPKKYKVVDESNIEPNKAGVEPIGNRIKFDHVYV